MVILKLINESDEKNQTRVEIHGCYSLSMTFSTFVILIVGSLAYSSI